MDRWALRTLRVAGIATGIVSNIGWDIPDGFAVREWTPQQLGIAKNLVKGLGEGRGNAFAGMHYGIPRGTVQVRRVVAAWYACEPCRVAA